MRSIRLIHRGLILMPVFIIPMVLPVFPYQEQEQKAKNPPPELTDEEKEIINNREMLEALPLLQNLDKIEFIDLLNEMEPDWSEGDESDVLKKEKEGRKTP